MRKYCGCGGHLVTDHHEYLVQNLKTVGHRAVFVCDKCKLGMTQNLRLPKEPKQSLFATKDGLWAAWENRIFKWIGELK